jgi:crotonobetainyl-CoA:carnitine CoA-transferase CaiB-like acyl-CoA transferase
VSGPLEGLLVIEVGQYLAAPYAGVVLSDLGARVIKVEPPDGDGIRTWGPYLGGESAPYLAFNRGKECVTADLRTPAGRQLLERLIERADVLVENNRPGVLSRYRLDPETVRARQPELIYCSITGYGADSPYAERPGFDLVIQGITGLMSITGHPDGDLAKVAVPIVDGTASLHATTAILAAVHERDQTGVGATIDISLQASTMTWMMLLAAGYFADGAPPARLGSAHPFAAPYQAFQAADGYLTIAAGNERQWQRLCQQLGLEELGDDERFASNQGRARHYRELAELLQPVLRSRDRAHWIETLSKAGVPCGPVYTLEQALDDPALTARGLLGTHQHPRAGTVRTIGNPIRIGGSNGSNGKRAPLQGEHTEQIMDELGLTTPPAAADTAKRSDNA